MREAETQAEWKQAPCRKPYSGLNPRTPGSYPGPKAGTKPLSHPRIPQNCVFFKNIIYLCFASFQRKFVVAHRDLSTSIGEKIDDKMTQRQNKGGEVRRNQS